MLFNEVLFPRKRSPFPKRGRHSLSPLGRVARSAERGHCLPLRGRWRRSRRKRSLPSPSGKVAAQPSEEVKNLIIYLDNIRIVFVSFQFRQEVLSLNRNKSRRSYPAPSRFFPAHPSAAQEFQNSSLFLNLN